MCYLSRSTSCLYLLATRTQMLDAIIWTLIYLLNSTRVCLVVYIHVSKWYLTKLVCYCFFLYFCCLELRFRQAKHFPFQRQEGLTRAMGKAVKADVWFPADCYHQGEAAKYSVVSQRWSVSIIQKVKKVPWQIGFILFLLRYWKRTDFVAHELAENLSLHCGFHISLR